MKHWFKKLRRTGGAALLWAVPLTLAAAGVSAELAPAQVQPDTAAPTAEDGAAVDETPALWFVELESPPAADGTSPSTLRQEKDAFRAAAAQARIRYTERYAFDHLWNGLSVEVSGGDVARLARLPGVKTLYPVATFSLPPEQPSAPDIASALGMTGADVAQSELGLSGAGVRVAVMDTGIDYHHPDLGGCFGPGCRVETGWDFVGDTFNADSSSSAYNPVPAPDHDPDDCGGHGTHVAGIIGANGQTRGVAPGVTFGAYRVFGCGGSTTADVMIAAMERALQDGMQVLNMSIGSAFQWPQYPTAQASDRLVNRGVVVVASAGNSGANGLYANGAPSLGSKVIAVASFDNVKLDGMKLKFADSTGWSHTTGALPATAAPEAPTAGELPLARTGTRTSPADACSPLPAGSLTGKAALIRRGSCTFHTKALNARNAGAVAVLIYNNVPGAVSATVAGTPAITIPVVGITDVDGGALDARLAAGAHVTLTWTAERMGVPNPTGGTISSFSSYGLSPDLSLKPDLGAPGGLIRATYPLERGGYAILSGTSMSAPHVAGAVGLLLEARPRTPPAAVRALLQNSADPRPWWGNRSFIENVHRQGAGMVDIDDAVLATTRVEPSKLSLGESEGGPAVRTLTIENSAAHAVTYDLSHTRALATGPGTHTPTFFTSAATVTYSAPSVTVPAGGTATVDVQLEAPASLADRGVYGGYLVLTAREGGATYRVPYAGMKGDYQGITALTPTPSGFPWLARRAGSGYTREADGATFTLSGSDLPRVLVHLDHQVRRLRLEVFDADTGRAWHRAMDLQYVGRNSTSTGFFAFTWDGETTSGNKTLVVPNGRYRLQLSVLKALGNEATPEHWERWTSPVLVIARPDGVSSTSTP